MVESFKQTAKSLEQQLHHAGETYQLIESDSESRCRVQFVGQFNQQSVVWDVTIRTLQDYIEEFGQTGNVHGQVFRQFIEIEPSDSCFRAQVVLKLDRIDHAAIGRTIIMFRKYKRLHLGRHEYGEPVTF